MVTALGTELNALRAHLQDVQTYQYKGTIYECGRLSENGPGVALVEAGPGNVGAALETERAIACFGPRLLLFVGVAGGLKDVGVGDVVAATKIYGYEGGKETQQSLSRPDIGTVSHRVEQIARAVIRADEWPRRRIPTAFDTRNTYGAVTGAIAAGEKVLAATNSDVLQRLREQLNDTVAVEMEGIGTARAVRANPAVDLMIIRGISDLIDGKAAADAMGSQEIASASAAAFAVELLLRYRQEFAEETLQPEAASPGPTPTDEGDIWLELEAIAADLYPGGPSDEEIWSRAGGDLASIPLAGTGRSTWHRALRRLRQGGGGTTVQSLLSAMLTDYPQHLRLAEVADRVEGVDTSGQAW